MDAWDTPRPSVADDELLVPVSKVQAWISAGAPLALVQDLAWGIHIRTTDTIPAASLPNYSCGDKQVHIDNAMLDLLREGKIEVVPADEINSTVISPLGVVPKPHSSKFRVIHDLSLLVNDYVRIRNMKLPTIEDLLSRISPGAWMWKRDWKNGFQQFFVEKNSRRLLGFWWDGRVWRYATLPFGLSTSPADFSQFSQFVRDLLRNEGIICWVYIDDLFGFNHSFTGAWSDFMRANQVHNFLQIVENNEKAVSPTQVADILGYSVNSVTMSISVPAEKFEQIKSLCSSFANRRQASLRQLQSLIGLLIFAARVIRGGWIFVSRMLPLLKVKCGASNPQILLTKAFQKDLSWWRWTLNSWSGTSCIPTDKDVHVFCDASSPGFGAWWLEEWFAGRWSSQTVKRHINWKELATIKMAVRKWAHRWSGCRVWIHCDNRAAVSICSKSSSRSPILARLMREIFRVLSYSSCEVHVQHIPGADNTIADSLSRL